MAQEVRKSWESWTRLRPRSPGCVEELWGSDRLIQDSLINKMMILYIPVFFSLPTFIVSNVVVKVDDCLYQSISFHYS